MDNINEVIINSDFYHCIERNGFVFTSIMNPANVLDAIVIRKPETCASASPIKSCSKRTLEEHISVINQYNLEKACVIADDIEFILKCPSLKYIEIIPSKTAPDNFDYSPLYKIPEIKYLAAYTEYKDVCVPAITTIDYSKIKGLKEVWMQGKGHENINKLESLEKMDISYMELSDLQDMDCCKTLKRLDVLKTGLTSLKGIGTFENLQWVSLDYERKLKDVSEIVETATTLRAFHMENCPKVSDFSFLEQLVNLEFLSLCGKNKLTDLNFLSKMPKLKTFIFSMEIENGDLTPCLNVPYVRCQKGKKYYNLKDRDLPKVRDKGGFQII